MTINQASIDIAFGFAHNLLQFEGHLADGRQLALSLDTCAWPHVVRQDLAAAAGWVYGEPERAEGAGGEHLSQAARVPGLKLGGLQLPVLEALSDPLGGPLPLDLMLGGPLLQDWVIEIDYPGRRLRCYELQAWSTLPRAGEDFELHSLAPGLPYLPHSLSLNGQPIPVALLDTGNNASIVVSSGLAASLKLEAEKTVAGGGFGGAELSFGLATLETVQLGTQVWRQVQALILPPQASALLAAPDRALIGNALLSQQIATWALPAGKWRLAPGQ